MSVNTSLPVGCFKKSFLGYNISEVDSNLNFCKNEYLKLYSLYEAEKNKNLALQEALQKKNLEYYELEKKYNQATNYGTPSALENEKIKTAQIIKQNMEFDKSTRKTSNLQNVEEVYSGIVEDKIDEAMLLENDELKNDGFIFI